MQKNKYNIYLNEKNDLLIESVNGNLTLSYYNKEENKNYKNCIKLSKEQIIKLLIILKTHKRYYINKYYNEDRIIGKIRNKDLNIECKYKINDKGIAHIILHEKDGNNNYKKNNIKIRNRYLDYIIFIIKEVSNEDPNIDNNIIFSSQNIFEDEKLNNNRILDKIENELDL